MIYAPAAVFIVGLVIYAVTDNPKASEIGRCLMWCGLLAFLLTGARQLVA